MQNKFVYEEIGPVTDNSTMTFSHDGKGFFYNVRMLFFDELENFIYISFIDELVSLSKGSAICTKKGFC